MSNVIFHEQLDTVHDFVHLLTLKYENQLFFINCISLICFLISDQPGGQNHVYRPATHEEHRWTQSHITLTNINIFFIKF